jgi:DNA-binding NarL/FixJ family response regulator
MRHDLDTNQTHRERSHAAMRTRTKISTNSSPDRTSDMRRRTARGRAPAVLVVESDAWLGSLRCDVLQAEAGVWLAGVAAGAEEAISMAERERFDVVVVGHRPPVESAFRLCRELKRTAAPPAVVICCAQPDGLLAACCAVADADALISMYHCGAELPGVLDRIARGVRFLPAVPPRTETMLRGRLDPAEYAVFAMLRAGFPTADIAPALRMSDAELESRRSALIGRLETLPANPEARSDR